KIKLPDRVFATADTPRALLREILNASTMQEARSIHAGEPVAQAISMAVPQRAETLLDVLDWHAHTHPDRTHIKFYSDDEQEKIITYGNLKEEAERIALGLQMLGVKAGETVSLMLPTSHDYFFSFFGIL